MSDDKNQQFSPRERLNRESGKRNRRFRTLDEIEEEYNETDHNFNDEVKDVWQNFKDQLFSTWGLLIMFMLFSAVLGALVR